MPFSLEPATCLPNYSTCRRYKVFGSLPPPLSVPHSSLPSVAGKCSTSDQSHCCRAARARQPLIRARHWPPHLCTVTGSFNDLLEEEAEASRASRSCFVRGSFALARVCTLRYPCRRISRLLLQSVVSRHLEVRSAGIPPATGPSRGHDAAQVSCVRLLSLSSPTLNAPLPGPPLPIGWPEAERLSAAPIRARFPTGFRGPAPAAACPGALTVPIGRRRAGRRTEQRRCRRARSSAAPLTLRRPQPQGPSGHALCRAGSPRTWKNVTGEYRWLKGGGPTGQRLHEGWL